MKRIWTTALLLGGIFCALILGSAASQATTLTLDFTGTNKVGGGEISGKITAEYSGVDTSTPGTNNYNFTSSAFSITIGGVTTNFTGALASAQLTEGPTPGTYGFVLSGLGGGVFSLILGSTDANPALPLLTLETMPTSYAGWVAKYGTTAGGGQILLTSLINYTLTGYNLKIAATPIPGSVLLFATALLGLGLVGRFRPRTVRLAAA